MRLQITLKIQYSKKYKYVILKYNLWIENCTDENIRMMIYILRPKMRKIIRFFVSTKFIRMCSSVQAPSQCQSLRMLPWSVDFLPPLEASRRISRERRCSLCRWTRNPDANRRRNESREMKITKMDGFQECLWVLFRIRNQLDECSLGSLVTEMAMNAVYYGTYYGTSCGTRET